MAANVPPLTKSRGLLLEASDSDQYQDTEAAANAGDFANFIPWAIAQYGADVVVDISRTQQVEAGAEKKVKKHGEKKESAEKSSSHTSDASQEPVDKTVPVVKIATTYLGENLVHFMIHKTEHIPRHLLFIIGLVIKFYPHLYGISLHSGVDKYTIHEMCKFLPHSHITELSFDNNILQRANYELVLDCCKELKVLSLSRCRVGDEVVKKIASKLEVPNPAAQTLNVLNISSNRLTDISAKALAEMLRMNRCLKYLNIADNKITDKGASAILNVFCSFPLKAEEVLLTKGKYMNYLKTKQLLIDSYMESIRVAEARKKFAKSSHSLKGKTAPAAAMSLFNYKTDAKTYALNYQNALEIANTAVGEFSDDFGADTFYVDGLLHSNGNNTVAYLNIAYNSLSYLSLRLLLKVLNHQKDLARTPKGLVNVCVEGNNLPRLCDEMIAIDGLLEINLSTLDKAASSAKKKAGKK